MRIDNDSPLRHLPADMTREQVLFFDSIRVTAEMADLSYGRLEAGLRRIGLADPGDKGSLGTELVAAMHDAWSLVDSLHRLRGLFDRCPGLQKSTVTYKRFRHATNGITDLRNFAQHLNTAIADVAATDSPAWGTLNWLTILDRSSRLARATTIGLGSLFESSYTLVDLAGRTSFGEIDAVTLYADSHKISLSEMPEVLALIVGSIEAGLREAVKGVPTLRSDLLLRANVTLPGPDDTDGESNTTFPPGRLVTTETHVHRDVGTSISMDDVVRVRVTPQLGESLRSTEAH
jgi:hypothetical protein